jgi:hypothetical protein
MDILGIFVVGAMIGKLEKFFDHEVQPEDFWTLPADCYQMLTLEERQEQWFTINPDKLNAATKKGDEILILSESQKASLLAAFQTLKNYTPDLPEGTHFKERMLAAKSKFPPIFFSAGEDDTEQREPPEGKLISFHNLPVTKTSRA